MLGGDKRSYILKQTFNQDFLVFFKYVCPFVTTSIKRGKEHHQLSIQLGGKVGPSPGMPGPPGLMGPPRMPTALKTTSNLQDPLEVPDVMCEKDFLGIIISFL